MTGGPERRLGAADGAGTDFGVLDALVRAGGPAAALDHLEAIGRRGGAGAELPLLHEALALSADILSRDRSQTVPQLLARLMDVEEPGVRLLVARARAWRGQRWLRPLTASLTPPGGPLTRILRGPGDLVTAVALSPDGRFGASGSYRRDVRVWDLARGLLVSRFVGAEPSPSHAEGGGGDAIVSLTFAGDRVVAASADRCVYAVDPATGHGEMLVAGMTDALYAVALSADGSLAVAGPRDVWGSTDTRVQVWDLLGAERLADLDGHVPESAVTAVSPDATVAATSSNDGTLAVWDLTRRRPVLLETSAVWASMALSGVGPGHAATLALGGADGTIVVRRPAESSAGSVQLTGHDGAVLALACAGPDRLVSGGADGTVRVWDLAGAREPRCLHGHAQAVRSVAVSADGRRVLSGGADGTVLGWDLDRAGDPAGTGPPPRHHGPVTAAAVAEDDLTAETGDAAGGVLRWHPVAGSGGPVGPGEARLLAPGSLAEERVREEVARLDELAPRGHEDSKHVVTGVAVSTDGRWALSSSTDRAWTFYRLGLEEERTQVRLWDLSTGTVVRQLTAATRELVFGGHVEAFRCVAVTADGSVGACGGDDRTLRVWDLAGGALVASFTGESAVTACALSGDGRLAVAGEASGRVHLFALEPAPAGTARGPSHLAADQGGVEAVAVDAGHGRAASAGRDGTVEVWDLTTGQGAGLPTHHADRATCVAFTPDGSRLVSGSADGTVRLWDVVSGARVALGVAAAAVWTVAGDGPDGRVLVGDGGGGVAAWDPDVPLRRHRVQVHPAAVTGLVGLGGGAVGTASTDGSLAVSDVLDGRVLWRSSAGPPVWALAAARGNLVAARGGALETWDAAGRLRRSVGSGHRGTVTAVAVDAEGSLVATGGTDGEVRLFDLAAGRPAGLLRRTPFPVSSLVFGPDGESVLVAGPAGVDVVPLAEGRLAEAGTLRDRFTDAEWTWVRRLPAVVREYVAAADGVVDPTEVGVPPLGAVDGPVGTPAEELARTLLREAAEESPPVPGRPPDPSSARLDGDLGLARALLRRRLDPGEYAQVVEVLLSSARRVAEATGGTPPRTGVGPQQDRALRELRGRL